MTYTHTQRGNNTHRKRGGWCCDCDKPATFTVTGLDARGSVPRTFSIDCCQEHAAISASVMQVSGWVTTLQPIEE